MVEVTLTDYISAHRGHRTNPTSLADLYVPALPACAVISIPQVDSRYLKKKTRVGLARPKKTRVGLGPWSR